MGWVISHGDVVEARMGVRDANVDQEVSDLQVQRYTLTITPEGSLISYLIDFLIGYEYCVRGIMTERRSTKQEGTTS